MRKEIGTERTKKENRTEQKGETESMKERETKKEEKRCVDGCMGESDRKK